MNWMKLYGKTVHFIMIHRKDWSHFKEKSDVMFSPKWCHGFPEFFQKLYHAVYWWLFFKFIFPPLLLHESEGNVSWEHGIPCPNQVSGNPRLHAVEYHTYILIGWFIWPVFIHLTCYPPAPSHGLPPLPYLPPVACTPMGASTYLT